ASRRDRPQVSRYPARMVIRQNGQPRSAREFALLNPPPHRFSHAAQFSIRTTFQVILPLKLQRDIIWPALRAFSKAVVESGLGSCGIYTKTRFIAEHAEISEAFEGRCFRVL